MPAVSGPRNCTILAISGPRIRNQKSPEWCSFWAHKLPEYGYFWSHKLPKRFLFVSGAINCQNGAVSGAINGQNGRQILYGIGPEDDQELGRYLNQRKEGSVKIHWCCLGTVFLISAHARASAVNSIGTWDSVLLGRTGTSKVVVKGARMGYTRFCTPILYPILYWMKTAEPYQYPIPILYRISIHN